MSDRTEYLVVPGWQGSGPDHWQSHWQARLANSRRTRVKDWHRPDREDWINALHHLITGSTAARVVLVAHSLGCVTVAHWAQRHGHLWSHRIAGALLVAPADVERPGVPAALRAFAPIPRDALPFPSLLVGSTNDRAASAQRARALAEDWESNFELLDGVGHINVASGHHHWHEGLRYLARFDPRPPAVEPVLLHGGLEHKSVLGLASGGSKAHMERFHDTLESHPDHPMVKERSHRWFQKTLAT